MKGSPILLKLCSPECIRLSFLQTQDFFTASTKFEETGLANWLVWLLALPCTSAILGSTVLHGDEGANGETKILKLVTLWHKCLQS